MTIHETTLHDIIRANVDRSPLFSGAIGAGGPRYCPSIEDKVFRFGDRDGHQIFLEPEGLDTNLIYPNGISTSLPANVQQAMISTIPGLAACRIVLPGYAVEYDYLDPRALDATLALPTIDGVFCAGQINGTTGYEEAAGQGLVAGLNAAALACDLALAVFDRATSYVGVMVDDLVLQGVTEPYRMLTARAEHRLALRADNAEPRLSAFADNLGCLSSERRRHVTDRNARRKIITAILSSGGSEMSVGGAENVPPDLADRDLIAEAANDVLYAPYVERQSRDIVARQHAALTELSTDLRYDNIPGLSNEMIERLSASRPSSLDAASRIRGISPAALAAILLHVKRRAA